jgi:(p)ppGpp synthase/HD superfamily hydrolase
MTNDSGVNADYAINNVQLLNRMRQAEYSRSDLEMVNTTYAFAISLFACRFEPSGRTFFSHIVRTAGLLVAQRAPLPLLCAALLHNVYQHGEFGNGTEGQSIAKQQKVRAVIGAEAEAIVAGFASRPWNSKTVCALRDELRDGDATAFSSTDRDVILLKIADHLEHELDFDPLYATQSNYKGFTPEANAAMREIAAILDAPLFACELQRAAQELETAPEIAPELRAPRPGSQLHIPASYCLRLPAAARRFYKSRRRALAELRYRWRKMRAG